MRWKIMQEIALFALTHKVSREIDIPKWCPFSGTALHQIVERYNNKCESYLKNKGLVQDALELSYRKVTIQLLHISDLLSNFQEKFFGKNNIILIDNDTMGTHLTELQTLRDWLPRPRLYDVIQISNSGSAGLGDIFGRGYFIYWGVFNDPSGLEGFLCNKFCDNYVKRLDSMITARAGHVLSAGNYKSHEWLKELGPATATIQHISDILNLSSGESQELERRVANRDMGYLYKYTDRILPRNEVDELLK